MRAWEIEFWYVSRVYLPVVGWFLASPRLGSLVMGGLIAWAMVASFVR